MKTKQSSTDTLTLQGQDIKIERRYLPHADLSFFPENPRIYSLVCADDIEPSQGEIEKKLIKHDHVKQLAQSIEANGGLTDHVLVRSNDLVVLEGNSRLAAYRLLSRKDSVKWGQMKCALLPKDISESMIFTLLGQYHIIGRKDWAPYEQAGYLYRRCIKHNCPPESITKEIGLSLRKVNSLIEVYSFMVKHNVVDVQRWSYYDEYLKSRPIKNARKAMPDFDRVIVKKIESGEVNTAKDIRDKVAKIADAKTVKGQRNLQRFINTTNSLDDCFETTVKHGGGNSTYKMLNSFREKIADSGTKDKLKNMTKEHLKRCKFELNRIEKAVTKINKELDGFESNVI
jgi:hypothetical protein